MATFSKWNPNEDFVQGGMHAGEFLSSKYAMIAAGPPSLESLGGATVATALVSTGGEAADQLAYPIGILQNFNLSQNKQLSRIFEIGSGRSYFIGGRSVGQVGLSRVMYHGMSLLRVLYAYYQDLALPTVVLPVYANVGLANMANPHDVQIPPGYENIFWNLASDLFDQPVGLLIYLKNSNLDTLGAAYLEYCYLPNHSMGWDAGGVVIQENASVQFERVVPVAVSGLGLVTGALNDIF